MAKKPRSTPDRAPSDRYQYLYLEIPVHPFQLASLTEASFDLDQPENEEIAELRQDLIKEVLSLIDTTLTTYQQKVMKYHLQGLSQVEIGKLLGVTQTAIHKCLSGNVAYNILDQDGNPRRFGGVYKKLRKTAEKSDRIQYILKKIKRIKNEEL